MFEEFKSDVTEWITKWVSVPNATFGHIPCPYAIAALAVNHIDWQFAKDSDDLRDLLDITAFDLEKPVLIIGMHRDSITPAELIDTVHTMNRTIMRRGLVALEDHPDDEEIVSNTKMNQGEWVLVMVQSLKKLNTASESLKGMGYYDNWTKEELADVVEWRFKKY